MKKIKVELENCYWIENFSYEFNFNHSKVYSIYAPNWTMKTSFLKWFIDYINEKSPKDVIHGLPWSIDISDNWWEFSHEVFPIESINHSFNPQEAYSTLLVNPVLRKKYETIVKDLNTQKVSLIVKLNKKSWIKKDILIRQMQEDFSKLNISFEDFLEKERKTFSKSEGLDEIKYNLIFDQWKVEKMLSDPDFSKNRKEYEDQMEVILKKFSYYKRWWFTPNVARKLLDGLRESSFMDIQDNWIILEWVPFKDYKKFETELSDSFKAIELNPKLKEIKDKILEWTRAEKEFSSLINKHSKLIPELKDKDLLRKKLWISYLYELQWEIDDYLNTHKKSLKDRKDILKQAKLEESDWAEIVEDFKERFFVPYKLWVEKSHEAILWITDTPVIQYMYEIKWKTWEYKTYNKKQLLDLDILSWWEKRAMYLLDILFEMKMREKDWKKHLIIIDDITDSFDYANKYAIIEYLKELKENSNFYFIILTHNFDFYRTIQWRLDIKSGLPWISWEWANLSANDTCDGLRKFWTYIQPFNYFKWKIKTDKYVFIACIPLVRNLIEYWENVSHSDYSDLTKILHKKDTKLNVTECSIILNSRLEPNIVYSDSISTYKYIIKACDEIVSWWTLDIPLEQKICLTIWMRLLAETIMRDKHWWWEEQWNQIVKLYNKTKHLLSEEENKYINKIMICTPESIHLNAFMFEPIIDMWSMKLQEIYKEIKALV